MTNPTSPVQRAVLSADQLADALGVCQRTLWRWRSLPHDPLPVMRAPGGRRLFFELDAVLEWLRRQGEHQIDTAPAPDAKSALSSGETHR